MANPSMAAYLGQRLRDLRQAAGVHQDAIAEAARETGLAWSQPTVAQIESGTRRLALEEFVLLPVVYGRRGVVVHLPGLFATDDRVEVTDETSVSALAVGLMLEGRDDVVVLGDFEAPFSGGEAKLVKERSDRAREYRDRLWPRGRIADVDRALRSAAGDAEQKAARRLEVSAEDLSVLAFRRWGHSLTAEREGRLAARIPSGATPRTAQAVRGFITRELVDEIAPDLEGRA